MKNNKGFTLIELSIVLTVVGLIVSGIVGGQSLIKHSKLQSIISQVNSYRTAINTYEMEYHALPGDHKNAQEYFSAADCQDGGVPKTCNGNDDGHISSSGVNNQESKRAWEHLGLAGLINGEYEYGGGVELIGKELPGTAIEGTGMRLYWTGAADNPAYPVYGKEDNAIRFGAKSTCNDNLGNIAITPADAKSIDRKIDNGMPRKGHVYGRTGQWCPPDPPVPCVVGSEYDLSNTEKTCILHFWLD